MENATKSQEVRPPGDFALKFSIVVYRRSTYYVWPAIYRLLQLMNTQVIPIIEKIGRQKEKKILIVSPSRDNT